MHRLKITRTKNHVIDTRPYTAGGRHLAEESSKVSPGVFICIETDYHAKADRESAIDTVGQSNRQKLS